MRKITAFLLSCVLAVAFLTLPAEAYDMGKVGEYQTISMGAGHTAAIKADGSLWVWGSNSHGQIGNGSIDNTSNPIKVLDNAASVSCGNDHTAALQGDGSLWVWGSNEYGQVGSSNGTARYGSASIQTTPVKLLDNVAAVSCGDESTAAIKSDGTLWMWGHRFGSAPIKIMDDVVAVSGEDLCYGVIKTDGTLWVWGALDVGYFTEYIEYKNPRKLASDVSSVSCSGAGVVYLKNDGTVWTWVHNSYGDRGDGTMDRYSLAEETPPCQVNGLSNAVSVSCGKGYNHIAAILADGSLWMWGDNWSGQLGIGGRTGSAQRDGMGGPSPVQTVPVKVMDQVTSAFCGWNATAAIKNDGTLWTWGDNLAGMLGYQDYDMRYTINDPGGSGTGIKTAPKQVENFAIKPSGGSSAVTAPVAPAVAGFTDVAADAYYAAPVAWAVEKGITTGTGATSFSPGQDCTNAQILTFLWRAYGQPEPTIGNPFANSIPDAYTKAAVWAYEKGMVSGTTFDADKPCTRAMAVKYMWQAAGSPRPSSARAGFTDVPNGTSYVLPIVWALDNGITTGTSATTFSPDEICSRGQIVTFLHRNLG